MIGIYNSPQLKLLRHKQLKNTFLDFWVVNRIKEEVKGLTLNSWYLADGLQIGDLEQLEQVVDILNEEGRKQGLVMSTTYTTVKPAISLGSAYARCYRGPAR